MSASIARDALYAATSTKVTAYEEKLKTRMDSLTKAGTEISQGDLLGLQYELQSYLMIFNLASTVQKELSEMVKSLIAKI